MTSDLEGKVPWLSEVSPDELRRIVDALHRASRFTVAITDLPTLLERIMEESKQVAAAEACSLMLYDAASEELYFQVALGESGDQQALKSEVRLSLDQGIAGAAAAKREAINVTDVQNDPRFFRGADDRTSFQTRSILAVPLIDRGALIGVLEVLNKADGGVFTEADLRVMQIFSGLTATAIANARLIEDNLRAERLAAIGQAVAGMSHYTKNIIAGMTNSVDLIDQGLETNNFEFLHSSWPIFRRSTTRIANFVEDMLAFSKPRKPIMQRCDLGGIVADAEETFRGMLVARQVTLDVDLSGVEGPVCVDERGVFRCLLNLLKNASDAVPRDDGRIWVRGEQTPDGTLRIEMEDNGPGVPESEAAKLFDPFFSTKGANGTGLGLAVTHKIVLEHGGHIEIERGAHGGALFRVVLPPAQPSID